MYENKQDKLDLQTVQIILLNKNADSFTVLTVKRL
jgi:hypothetical protein